MNQRILIVDDEDLQRMTMKSRLQSAGYTVDTAAGGEEALRLMKDTRIDIVLLDIRMPGMDGIETLNMITRDFPQIEVVMMTGFADFITAVECLKSGARDYLVKPIHPTELVTRLNTLVRERELRSSLHELKKNYSTGMLYSILSPINSITTIIDHVTKGRSGQVSKEQTYLLTYARNLGDRAVDMIKNLAAASGDSDSAGFIVESKQTDLAALIESVSLRYEILSRPKGLKIVKSFGKPLPYVSCDTEKIQQVFNNILDYSLEHSLSGGTISISVTKKQESAPLSNKIMITIKDSGIGIPGNGLSKIFNDKKEGQSDISADLKLTEIGLAVSKYLVEAHGGTIEVDSDAGSGNLFVITLPVSRPVPQES